MKKTNLFKMLLLLFVCSSMFFTGCDRDDQDSGYALRNLSGKTMNYDGMVINFSSNNSCSLSFTNSSFTLQGSPSCSYTKTSANSATFTLNYSYAYHISSSTTWYYTCSDQVTLYFISPNEGYASGSSSYTSTTYTGQNSGTTTISNESFTIF